MDTSLKLLCIIVQKRLDSYVELCKLINGGFRSKEEAVSQAACLRTILKRRSLLSKYTYVCFVDSKKTYDSVPHNLLWFKIS